MAFRLRPLLGALLALSPLAAAPRVALHVDAPQASAEWQTALTAELSRLTPETELVERGELARLWREHEHAALAASASLHTAAPLAVDRYLHFRRVGDARWIVEHIDAATGRALGSFAVDAAELSSAPRLADAAARLLAAPPAPDPAAAAPRVAIVESADSAGDASLFTLAARLRAALADEGLVILDRALTQEIAVEQNDAARGFRATPPAALLLGLDAYLTLGPREARLVRVSDGVVLGLHPRTASAQDATSEVNALQRWALSLLSGPGSPAAPATDYLPQVETEALEPFYRGIAHFDAGRFAESIGEFIRAYELNGRFREAYEWSARAHEALGLPEVAAAIRRFLDTEFVENLAAPTGRVVPVDGLAFLGVGGPRLEPAHRDALAAAIASRLAQRSELGLRLPDQLSRLRAEFDWSRLGAAPPASPPEPALFTRRVLTVEATPVGDVLELTLTLRDALGLRPPERKQVRLPSAPDLRAAAIRAFFGAWPATREATPREGLARHAPSTTDASVDAAALAAAIAAHSSEAAASADRLRLLLADSAHPLSIVRRSVTADEPLASFLEHGRREAALRQLPPGSVARRWFELFRALEHLDPLGPGPLFSGHRIDARAEIARLAQESPADGPGLVARYHLLFLAQAEWPPARIAAEAEELRALLRAAPDHLRDCAAELDLRLAAFARLARLAHAPRAEDLDGLDKFDAPTDLVAFRFTPEGRLACVAETYAITRRTFAGLAPEQIAAEATALLAINGRATARANYTSALLAAHPRSPALAQFVVLRLSKVLDAAALPPPAEMDWDVRQALVFAGYAYVMDYAEHTFAHSDSPDALYTANVLATALLGTLGHARLREWLPSETHAEAHARLSAAEASARARVDHRKLANPNAHDLATLTPDNARRVLDDDLRHSGVWIGQAAPIRRTLQAREAGFQPKGREATRSSWWRLATRWEIAEAMTATERADLVARPLEAILASFDAQANDEALGRHLDLGLMLFYGRRHADAERVFSLLATLPDADSSERARRAVIANARLRLAQIHQIAGRLPEAITTAREGLALADGHGLPLITNPGRHKHIRDTLSPALLRLLAELRHDPARTPFAPRVGYVRVPTRNADNPLLTVYYRTPPPPASASTTSPPAPARALILCPVHNTDPLETLSTRHAWTEFADHHGLVLISPRFHVSVSSDRFDHAFTHARYAAAWSGEAMLLALDEIARRTPLDVSRVFLHGQASGSGFASHFAAWRPERVAALSLAKGNWGLAAQVQPAHAPLTEQIRVPVWIGANPQDNHHSPGAPPRHAYLLDYAQRLLAAGADLRWEEFPASGSAPTPAMEDAARAFLARHLSP